MWFNELFHCVICQYCGKIGTIKNINYFPEYMKYKHDIKIKLDSLRFF
jgi:hypothetical protein